MKAKGLMIGDLFKDYKDSIVRITSLEGCGELAGVENDFECNTFVTEYLNPIPLTPEILEKNDWSLIEGGEYYHHDGVPFVIDTEQIGGTNPDLYCSYNNYVALCINFVHELQHAFRLCGLIKLADNFQV